MKLYYSQEKIKKETELSSNSTTAINIEAIDKLHASASFVKPENYILSLCQLIGARTVYAQQVITNPENEDAKYLMDMVNDQIRALLAL